MTTISAPVGRFVLRDFMPWDAPALFVMTGDAQITKYMGFKTHAQLDEAMQLIETYNASPSVFKAVCLDDEVIGVVGVEILRHQATLTIMFRRDWKARGAGREFSKLFVKWIFTHPQIWRVWAFCHENNLPVRRVLERMGAQCEGCMRRFEVFPNLSPEPQTCLMFAITR